MKWRNEKEFIGNKGGVIPCGIGANVLNCNILVNLNSSHIIAFTFKLLEKIWTPYLTQLWVK